MKIYELFRVPSFSRGKTCERSIGDSRHVPEQFNSSGNIVAACLLSRAGLVKGASFSPIVKSGRIVGSYSTGRDPKPVLPDRRTLGDCVRDVGEVMVRRSEAKTPK